MLELDGLGHSSDEHATAKARFFEAFRDVGDAALMTDSIEVITAVGPLASRVTRVGTSLLSLPPGVISEDLESAVSSVLTTSGHGVIAHLLLADGTAVSMRLFTIVANDRVRRYLVGMLAADSDSLELGRLRRTDRVYELWFDRAPTGVGLVATDGTFLRANPAFCRLLGRTELELQQMTFQDITHPDDLLLDVSLREDVLAGRIDRYAMEKRYLRPDGSIVWAHLTVALLSDEFGTPLHFISMVEDITERRLAQDRLTATMELWRTMFDFTPIAMAELGVDGTIMRANAAAGMLFGCPPEDLVGHRTPDLGHPEEAEVNTRDLARLASGEMLSNVSERRVRDLRGRQRWLSAYTAAVVDAAGGVDRLVMQVVDITEARELRERLQRSVDELSVAYREKATLMTALSHDLRTPLATIRILAELLVVDGESTVEGGASDLARRLLAESARTEAVLGDLFRSERASAGSITPRRVSISLNDLVRRVVHVEADQRSSHEIIVRLADEDCIVLVDPALVERMIANLISNAIRHTSVGSKVWVSVAVAPAFDDGAVQLVVEDDGGGVPDVHKEAIFEPYVSGSSPDRPGSGIGLFLVRRFAEFHGGTVVCEDRVGGGASFRVTLPRE